MKLKLSLFLLTLHVSFSISADPSIAFEVTVGTDTTANACAATNTINVDPGVAVNYCYRVTNDGDTTFDTQSLSTNAFGDLITDNMLSLAPTQSFQFNDIQTATSTVDLLASWRASEVTNTLTILTSSDLGGPTYDFTDISSTGTALGLSDDGESSNLSLGFDFTLINLTSSDILIGNNGALRLGLSTGEISHNNSTLASDPPNNLIAPFWDDIDSDTGDVYYQSLGTAPNRIFIVQWHNRPHFSNIGSATFQVKLFEGSNEIQFHYQDVDFGNASFDFGASATVGVAGVADAVQFSYNSISLTNNFAIAFIAASTETAESSATVVVNSPDIDLTQSAFSFTTQQTQPNASTDLIIDNIGTYVLNWNLEEAASREFKRLPAIRAPKTNKTDVNIGAKPFTAATTANNLQRVTSVTAGSSVQAFTIRAFPDDPATLTTIDIASASLINDINSSVDYSDIYTADFYDKDYSQLFALKTSNIPAQLVSINTSTGDLTIIGDADATISETFSGMTWDRTTGNMYAVSTSSAGSTLYTIDVTTGVTSVVGAVGIALIIDIAADVDGNIYGVTVGTDELIGINKTTAQGTLIGPTNFDTAYAQGLDFDLGSNTLYWSTCTLSAGCGELRTINLATGNSTAVAQIGAAHGNYVALAIRNDVACGTDIAWLSFFTTSGSTASGLSSIVGLNIDSTGMANGQYTADICIRSDDIDEPLKIIPLTLNVGADLIFANGFE